MKKYYKLLWLFPIALYQAGGLMAQNAEDEESVFELSPFQVDASADIGYSATSTLAGTRLNTNLRDIAASISVINQEFLEDTASTNIADVLLFTPNTEISGPNGNFSGYQSTAGSPIPEGELDRQQGGTTRVRGLAKADLTRNYFLSDVPFDTFNVDRIAVQRGANSALFGIGSPGGIVNHSTIQANLFGSNGRVKFETDEHGTARGSFRYNHVILEDKLSILVAGLAEDRKYEQEEAFMEDERIYLSLLWKITENIRFRASFEDGDRHSANPDQTPPNDGITPWIDNGKPIVNSPKEGAEIFWTPGVYVPGQLGRWWMTFASSGTSVGHANYYNTTQAAPYAGGPTRILGTRNFPDGDAIRGEVGMLQPLVREETIRRTGFHPNGAPVEPGTAGFYVGGFLGSQILDRSIFDYQKHLYHGGTYQQNANWDIFQASLEGTWWDNKVGFDISLYRQDWQGSSQNQLQGRESRSIYIDPNRFLIATTDGQPDSPWIPNPNFGRPVISSYWQGNQFDSFRESERYQAFIDLHAEDFLDESSIITKILGNLKLTGLYQQRELRARQAYSRDKVDPQVIVDSLSDGNLGASNGEFNRAHLRTGSIFELPVGNDINFLNINSLSDLSGVNIGAVPLGNQRNRSPKNAPYTGWNHLTGEFVDFTADAFNLSDNNNFPAAFFAGKSLETLDSEVLVAQHFLWDRAIVLMGTWRNDVVKSTSLNAPNSTGVYASDSDNTLDPTYVAGPQKENLSTDADEDTTSWAATVHLRELLGERFNFMPDGMNFSLFASEADNFQPTSGNVTILNDPVAPITGSTEERGAILELMDGKFVLRFNDFKTGILNRRFDAGGVSSYEAILRGLVEQTINPNNIANGFTVANAQAVLPPQGVLDLNQFQPDWANATVTTNRNSGDTGTQDFTASGQEIEISYNPTSQWTVLVGVAKHETVLDNTYPVLRKFVEDFVRPILVESPFAQQFEITDSGETLAQRAKTSIIDPVAKAITQDGIPTIEQRKLRFTINTSYRFGRKNDMIPDFLGDFTLGGGYRWEDRLGIGFGVSPDQFGGYALDPNKPFWGPKQDFLDLFFRSQYQLSDKYGLTVQLNIKDVFDNNDLVPIFANPDSTKIYRFLPGRLITLSGTLEF